MKDRIVAKGVPHEKVVVIPPWSHDDAVRFDEAARQSFRARHGLCDKFVVMYSGNHSPCHPLDTLLQAAEAPRLPAAVRVLLCGRRPGIRQGAALRPPAAAGERPLPALSTVGPAFRLPFGRRPARGGAGRAVCGHRASLQGLQHPPHRRTLLAISPAPSHITDLLSHGGLDEQSTVVPHGDVEGVLECVRDSAAVAEWRDPRRRLPAADRFSQAELLPRLVDLLVPPRSGERRQVSGERCQDGDTAQAAVRQPVRQKNSCVDTSH